jgi:hypothetical protein
VRHFTVTIWLQPFLEEFVDEGAYWGEAIYCLL